MNTDSTVTSDERPLTVAEWAENAISSPARMPAGVDNHSLQPLPPWIVITSQAMSDDFNQRLKPVA